LTYHWVTPHCGGGNNYGSYLSLHSGILVSYLAHHHIQHQRRHHQRYVT